MADVLYYNINTDIIQHFHGFCFYDLKKKYFKYFQVEDYSCCERVQI